MKCAARIFGAALALLLGAGTLSAQLSSEAVGHEETSYADQITFLADRPGHDQRYVNINPVANPRPVCHAQNAASDAALHGICKIGRESSSTQKLLCVSPKKAALPFMMIAKLVSTGKTKREVLCITKKNTFLSRDVTPVLYGRGSEHT